MFRFWICFIIIACIWYFDPFSTVSKNVSTKSSKIGQSFGKSKTLLKSNSDEFDSLSSEEVGHHYFSIELLEPGVTELSCLAKNFLYRWHQHHPDVLFHLYVVGSDTLQFPTTLPNLRVHELNSSLIDDTPLKWWLGEHVYWKYQTAIKTIITFDMLNTSYNPSDYPIPIFQHVRLIYSALLLWHYGGTYISTHTILIKPITTIVSKTDVTLIRRKENRIGLDLLSFMTSQHDLIKKFLSDLSDAYRTQDVMTIDGELILAEVIKIPPTSADSIHILPESTFYKFDRDDMFSNWFTTVNSLDTLSSWRNDKDRYGVTLPIVRVAKETPIPVQNSLIDRLTSLPPNLLSSKQISCFHVSSDRIHMGQLVYQNKHNYGNNGDYVQAWASLQYYPCVDRFYERDNMQNLPHLSVMKFGQSTFRNDSFTPVSIVMNAWWAHIHKRVSLEKFWPPPDHFKPVYVAVHIQNMVRSVMVKNSTTYVKYGPVGTRDTATLKLYNDAHIPAWFSGCLTTTLKFQPVIPLTANTRKPILVVDVPKDLLQSLVPPEILENNVQYSTAMRKPMAFDKIFEQLEEFDIVRTRFIELLTSKLVITTRLHVLLPCLALKVPAMFVYRSKSYQRDTRFGGLVGTLASHVYTEDDFFFWKNASHPHFINWENPEQLGEMKTEELKKIIFGLHNRLKQENEFRVWGRFYRVFS